MMLDLRLFTALSLPDEMLAKFDVVLRELEPLARINWSPLSELHITAKFVGAFPFNRFSELCRFLDGLPRMPKFPVTVTGLRYMPGPRKSWILFGRVEPSPELHQVVEMLDQSLDAMYGVPRERREFLPHVTIARIPGNNPWPELDRRVESHLETPFGSFEAAEYHLYESTPSGYRKSFSIPLI